MNYIVEPAGNAKIAIRELQGRVPPVVVVGGNVGAPVDLPGVESQRVDPLLFSVTAFLTAGGPPVDKLSACTLGSKTGTIVSITLTDSDPVNIEDTAHGLTTGDVIRDIAGVVGSVELNGTSWVVDVVDVDNFTLRGSDSSDYTAYTSGGTFSSPQRTLEFTEDLTTYTLMVEVYMQPEV